jgi:serine/threonine protein kinase
MCLGPQQRQYVTHSTRDGRAVVLKLVLKEFISEVEILRDLQASSHIIPVLDYTDGMWGMTITMPAYTPMGDLPKLLPNYVLALARQLLEGVAYMHRRLVAHRDLKPSNIVIDSSSDPPSLFIIDFGLALRLDTGDDVRGFAGTEGFVAPEVEESDGTGSRYSAIGADLWATGNILYHMLKSSTFPGDEHLIPLCRIAECMTVVQPRD